MSSYVYPATFTKEDTGDYSVVFNDLKGCATYGDTLSHAYEMATDALCLYLWSLEDKKLPIPAPTIPENKVISENEFVALIGADVDAYRRKMENKAVKKTLTIPSWLNEKAEEAGINFSQVLQRALKEELSIAE